MSIFFSFLALADYLSLAACRADEEQRRLLDEIIERSAMIDSEKKKIISYKGDIARLKTHLDSVSKDAELYQKKIVPINQQLHLTLQAIPRSTS